jgi:hypothetical protein
MIVGQRRSTPKQQRPEWGYHHLQDTEADLYVRTGSAAVNWSAAEGDSDFSWKTI